MTTCNHLVTATSIRSLLVASRVKAFSGRPTNCNATLPRAAQLDGSVIGFHQYITSHFGNALNDFTTCDCGEQHPTAWWVANNTPTTAWWMANNTLTKALWAANNTPTAWQAANNTPTKAWRVVKNNPTTAWLVANNNPTKTWWVANSTHTAW